MKLRYSFISTGKSKKNKTKEVVNEILPLGRKLFEEVDKPTGSKVVFEDKDKFVILIALIKKRNLVRMVLLPH
jgi:hypothetical protein